MGKLIIDKKREIVLQCVKSNLDDNRFVQWLYRLLECEGAEK